MATDFAIRHAVHCIQQGGIIAYPTETIYGLGCDPLCAEAVADILLIKDRDVGKGLILIASRIEQLDEFIDVTDSNDRAAMAQQETPTTWVVPAKADAPEWITGGRDTVAVRISPHPVVIHLCDQLGHALVSTSANPSGSKPAMNALQLHRYFDGMVDSILISNHNLPGKASVIKDLRSGRLLRK